MTLTNLIFALTGREIPRDNLDGLVESCQRLSLSEQEIFDQVKQCLPWRSDECIGNGLKRCQFNFEETIEYLINDPESDRGIDQETDEKSQSGGFVEHSIEETVVSERHSKVKLKKGREKVPVISKKEQRKQKKEKDAPKKCDEAPPIHSSTNSGGVIVL